MLSVCVDPFANLPKKMASSLKSCHRTSLKVVEDSIREAQIEQSNVDFGTEIDMEKFVFVEYKDVAEPDTDPADHMHGNSEENCSSIPVSKMPTNSENAKSLAEAEAKKVTGKSTEPVEIDNAQQTEENNRLYTQVSTGTVQGTTPSCPVGSEASGEPHFEILDWRTLEARLFGLANFRMDLEDQFREMLEGDDFNQDDYEFYEEVSDESDANGETSKDEEVSERSDGSFYVVKYPDTQVPK